MTNRSTNLKGLKSKARGFNPYNHCMKADIEAELSGGVRSLFSHGLATTWAPENMNPGFLPGLRSGTRFGVQGQRVDN